MRYARTIAVLASLVSLCACGTKGELKAPCPSLSSYTDDSDGCGTLEPVNDVFGSIMVE